MKSLIGNIYLQWDLWVEQYRAFFPTSEEDLEACREFLGPEKMGDRDLPNVLAACQHARTGEIQACLQLVDAVALRKIKNTTNPYLFERLPEERLPRMAVFRNLVARDDESAAVLVLMSHCFVEVLKAGGQAVLMNCDPDRFYNYKRLGMRPISPLYKLPEEGGHRIAMICLPDQDYLSIINSPILPLLRSINFSSYQDICQWYYQLIREHSDLRTGSAYIPEGEATFEGHHNITEGLSERGREAFLKGAFVMHFREGEVMISEKDGGKTFGFIRKGMVRVMIGEQTIVTLGPGDILGEIAFILHSNRSARVIAAAPETEVVLFNESALNRLPSAEDRMIIWRNLARILAQRVVLTNKLLS
jgi:hypothetical protein